MSCVSFGSTGDGGRRWLERLRAAAADQRPVSTFRSPEGSEAKQRRIELLAQSTDPRIRESAALSYHASEAVLRDLAADAHHGVRSCVARNEKTPADLLDTLAHDVEAGVRGWVAANPSVGRATLTRLADDPDPVVRDLVVWAARWKGAGAPS